MANYQFSQLYNLAFRYLRDTAKTKYDLDTVKGWINDAERQYCRLTHFGVEKNTTITTASGTQEYALPGDFLLETEVFYDGEPLRKRHQEATIARVPESGAPRSYYIKQKLLGLYAVPTAAKTITLIYWAMGGTMSADADLPIIPDEHQLLLVYFAGIQMALEGDDDRMAKFLKLWNDGIYEAKIEVVEKYYINMCPVATETEQDLDPINHDLGP